MVDCSSVVFWDGIRSLFAPVCPFELPRHCGVSDKSRGRSCGARSPRAAVQAEDGGRSEGFWLGFGSAEGVLEALEADRCVNPEPPALLPAGLPRLDLTGPDRRELTGPGMSGFKFRGAGLAVLFLLAGIWESNLLFLNLCVCVLIYQIRFESYLLGWLGKSRGDSVDALPEPPDSSVLTA